MRALLLPAILLLGAIESSLSAEESCVGRCLDGFKEQYKCQCDELCVYYQSCCADYNTVCNIKDTRGDVFTFPEDEYEPDLLTQVPSTAETTAETTTVTERPTEESVGEDLVTDDTPEELCSGKPFDAFTNFKNGSIYAFRGKYFYELDDKKALDGYPKLIKDVWGIEGPIDAAFTRMNCQGKTYIFKGTQYWRFSDGVLDEDYPRDIEVGFSGIPNNIDAAFALPANNYQGQERAYFFKGRLYWQYEFTHQPSRSECLGSSQSELFKRYAVLQDDSWEDIFRLLVGDWFTGDTIQAKQKDTVAVVNGTPNQRKRKRTLYSKWQQLELESVFEVIPYPDINTREQLAKIIRLPESKVQVWFQNRRARKNKNNKLDKTLYRRNSSFCPPHPHRNATSPSHNYSQRDPLITMNFPPKQVGPFGQDNQQVFGGQQSEVSFILQPSPPISQQYSAEDNYHCIHEHSQWQNLSLSGINSGYCCEGTFYGTQSTDFEHCTTPSFGPSYWEVFPHAVSANGSQTSLGYISDVIYNAAILTNLGDL